MKIHIMYQWAYLPIYNNCPHTLLYLSLKPTHMSYPHTLLRFDSDPYTLLYKCIYYCASMHRAYDRSPHMMLHLWLTPKLCDINENAHYVPMSLHVYGMCPHTILNLRLIPTHVTYPHTMLRLDSDPHILLYDCI